MGFVLCLFIMKGVRRRETTTHTQQHTHTTTAQARPRALRPHHLLHLPHPPLPSRVVEGGRQVRLSVSIPVSIYLSISSKHTSPRPTNSLPSPSSPASLPPHIPPPNFQSTLTKKKTHSHTHTPLHTHCLSLSFPPSLPLSLSHTHAHTYTHTPTSLSHPHTLTHTRPSLPSAEMQTLCLKVFFSCTQFALPFNAVDSQTRAYARKFCWGGCVWVCWDNWFVSLCV